MKLRLATRESLLALWQANYVIQLLESRFPDLEVEIIGMTTTGDKKLDQSLAKIGGKGLFVKELEHALLENKADIAVHSMKDVPMNCANGLEIAAICARANPFDALLANHYSNLEELPKGACVGTSSLRRQCQLKHYRSDLEVKLLRGNVPTRLQKLIENEFDAIILAVAGLERLQLATHIRQIFTSDIMLPAIGQGAIGIECRSEDKRVYDVVKSLNDEKTWLCLQAERTLSQRLGGSCQVPLAGYATIDKDKMILTGLIGDPQGRKIIKSQFTGKTSDAVAIGDRVADHLFEQGAKSILEKLDV